jgi:hypothetical protein
MNIERIYLGISLIFMIIMYLKINNLEKNNKIENFKNGDIVEHASNTEEIKKIITQEYNLDIEAIRNLGAISKSLLTGKNYHNNNTSSPGTLTIPGNTIVEGWAVTMPIGGIMLWTKTTPPPPNTTGFKLTEFTLSGADRWAPCNGENGTPDLRNRFPIGQGNWNKSLKSLIGGNVPTRNHIHSIGNDSHNHQQTTVFAINDHNQGGKRWTVSADDAFAAGWKNQDNYDKVVVDSSNKTRDTSHSHGGKTGWSSKPDNKNEAHPYRQDNYDHATVPYAAVIQYWMRVR